MLIDGYAFAADVVAKFHHSILAAGWFYHEQDRLGSVELTDASAIAQTAAIGLPHPHVALPDGSGAGFRVQALRETDNFPDGLAIRFATHAGRRIEASLHDLAHERLAESATSALYHRFIAAVERIDRPTIVDIGGRDRSDFDREADFSHGRYIVVDVLPGENVDIVADAHQLSHVLPPAAADAAIAVATFEHLLMPWKVVVEINRVLKPGGLLCIVTHQTLALHDMPWDFWRLSGDAWDGLLNRYTGFEIVERAQAREQFIVPFLYHPAKWDAERAAGVELVGVIARKTGPALVDWPVPLRAIISTRYPSDGPGDMTTPAVQRPSRARRGHGTRPR